MVAMERGHTSDKAMMNVPEIESMGKREQILEAAIKVFAYKGFSNAKVEEIANEAQVGKGTVYEYFKSKQDLFQEMFKYIHSLYFHEFVVDAANKTSFKEKIKYMLEANIKFTNEHREMSRIFLSEHPPLDEKFKKWVLDMHDDYLLFLQKYITEAISKDEIKEMDPCLLAKIIAAVITFFGKNMMMNETEMADSDISKLSADTINLLFSGISK
ncbi:MAG: hypothetical protein APF76_02610 [Desulfitibacter sp. BRH_c19]|nr:MAG: hypothetical protein APF76_02610 [Desulfitibacter sp. BRH_c19]